MLDDCITELPEKYFDKQKSIEAFENMVKQLVKKHPAMFAGEKWDKYRETKKAHVPCVQ